MGREDAVAASLLGEGRRTGDKLAPERYVECVAPLEYVDEALIFARLQQ